MQTRSRVFDDLAKVAGGAVSALSGIKAEIEAVVRQQIERLLVDADMVPRDEFDAVKALASNARKEQEILEKRVRQLERKLGVKAPGNSPGNSPGKSPGKPPGKSRPAGGKKPARKAAAKKAKAAKPKKKSRPQSRAKKSRAKK